MGNLQEVLEQKAKEGVRTTPDLERHVEVLSQLFSKTADTSKKPPARTNK